jgi:hypothetical protein
VLRDVRPSGRAEIEDELWLCDAPRTFEVTGHQAAEVFGQRDPELGGSRPGLAMISGSMVI